MDVDLVRWLGSHVGRELLRDLGPYAEARVPAESTRLRALGLTAEQVAGLLTQQRLRTRAREKFGELADELLFTADGLEQASRAEVAAGHAERFAAAGLERVHDLGCGMGADAIALAQLGIQVEGLDSDPVTAAVAAANLAPWPGCHVAVGRVEDWLVDGGGDATAGAWLDPARRVSGVADTHGRARRIGRLADISPSWGTVREIAEAVPATGAKLSPSFPHNEIPPGSEAQWVSRNGEVLECAIWWGPLVRAVGRTARILRAGSPALDVTQEQADDVVPQLASVAALGPWLYEVDRALVQAALVGAVTSTTRGRELEPGLGFVTADTAYDLDTARRYAVHEILPLSAKPIRNWLRSNGVTGLTIKKRGVKLDEDVLRRDLRIGRGAGDGATAILLLTRVAGRPHAIVVAPG